MEHMTQGHTHICQRISYPRCQADSVIEWRRIEACWRRMPLGRAGGPGRASWWHLVCTAGVLHCSLKLNGQSWTRYPDLVRACAALILRRHCVLREPGSDGGGPTAGCSQDPVPGAEALLGTPEGPPLTSPREMAPGASPALRRGSEMPKKWVPSLPLVTSSAGVFVYGA